MVCPPSLYSLNLNPSQIPPNPPSALKMTPHNENAPAPQRLGINPPIVEPTNSPSQIIFLSIPKVYHLPRSSFQTLLTTVFMTSKLSLTAKLRHSALCAGTRIHRMFVSRWCPTGSNARGIAPKLYDCLRYRILIAFGNFSMAYRSIVRGIWWAYRFKNASSVLSERLPTSRSIQPTAL